MSKLLKVYTLLDKWQASDTIHMHPTLRPLPHSRLPIKRPGNTDTRLPGRRRIQRNIAIELGALSRDLRARILSLRLLDLQPQNLKLQFEDFILNLAVLQGRRAVARSGQLIVEPSRARLGGFGDEARILDDRQVGGGDPREVASIDLWRVRMGVRRRWLDLAQRKLTGKLARTSATELPATPSEIWKSS